jgi:hypothetical protein
MRNDEANKISRPPGLPTRDARNEKSALESAYLMADAGALFLPPVSEDMIKREGERLKRTIAKRRAKNEKEARKS